MADLIDKQAALEIAMSYCPDDDGCCTKAGNDIREMLDEIEALPAIEQEVQHGQWIPTVLKGLYRCSACNFEQTSNPNQRFCSYCGAKMNEGVENA